jgi:hypothetical protein
MLKYLPGALRMPNQLATNLKYMNLGYSDYEAKANNNFLKLVAESKNYIPDEFNFKGRKYKKVVENTNLYQNLKQMPKGLVQFTNIEAHPYMVHYMRRSFDTKLLANEDFKQKKLFQNIHDPLNKKNICPQVAKVETQKLKKESQESHLKGLNTKDNRSWRKWLYNSCVEALNEGILNVQAKIILDNVVSEEEKVAKFEEELQVYLNCVKDVQKLDRDFRFSLVIKGAQEEHINQFYPRIQAITNECKDLIVGFENHEYPTRQTVSADGRNVSLTLSDNKSEINDHVIDYLLVKCPKIGHGINQIKNSSAFEDMKERNIYMEASIEANPHNIDGHQIMKFNTNNFMSHHPIVNFLQKAQQTQQHQEQTAQHQEDPSSDLRFVTWDFFGAAFSMEFDLYDFKKVCLNSITSNDISEEAKQNLKKGWELRWNKYVRQLCASE